MTSHPHATRLRTSRRELLKGAAAAALVSIVPAHVLGQSAPSEKVNFAAIGAGGQAGSDIRSLTGCGANLVAFADVDQERATRVRDGFKDARHFVDFREMLDQVA